MWAVGDVELDCSFSPLPNYLNIELPMHDGVLSSTDIDKPGRSTGGTTKRGIPMMENIGIGVQSNQPSPGGQMIYDLRVKGL